MQIRSLLPGLAVCLALSAGPVQAAVTEDDFQLRSSGDLADLCSAAQPDPMYTAASNFCHGFAVGVFRVLQEEDTARKATHMFCLPPQTPTRNEAIAGLVQWIRADNSRMALPPADAIAAYLSQQYPCARRR
jgi:Rap1a immunity proteins